MAENAPNAFRVLQANAVFGTLSEPELRDLASVSVVERYQQCTLLAARGEKLDRLRYVVAGSVNLSLSTGDGQLGSLPVLPGMWATWIACFMEAAPVQELWTSRSAVYLSFPISAVRSAISQRTTSLLRVINEIGLEQRALIVWNLATTAFQPERRLAYFLATALRSYKVVDPTAGGVPFTQEEIGQFGFGSRQRVGRLLQRLEELDLIRVSYGTISAASLDRLDRFAFEN